MAMQATTQKESIKVEAAELVEHFKRLVHEGNVRRIVIRQGDDIVVEFPLTIAVVGALFAPMLAAVGAIAALLTDCAIDVEREDGPSMPRPGTGEGSKLEDWMKY
jgi:hypothetical protein